MWSFLKKLKVELPYHPAIRLLNIYLDKTVTQKDTCTPTFIAALVTIAKTRKPLECPPIDEWIKKMWYIYTTEYYSATKKNEIMPFAATWMNLEIIVRSKVRKRKTDTICYHLYVESKEMTQINSFVKQKQMKQTHIENKFVIASGEVRGGMEWEFGVSRYKDG